MDKIFPPDRSGLKFGGQFLLPQFKVRVKKKRRKVDSPEGGRLIWGHILGGRKAHSSEEILIGRVCVNLESSCSKLQFYLESCDLMIL